MGLENDTIDADPRYTDNALRRLEIMADVQFDQLSTMLITTSTPEPYNAVLEYLGIASCPNLKTEAEDSTIIPSIRKHSRNVLFISPQNHEEPKDDLSDVDEDDDGTDDGEWNSVELARYKGQKGGQSSKNKSRFSFGIADVKVSWPPPPQLQARHLYACRRATSLGLPKPELDSKATVHENDAGGEKTRTTFFVSHFPVGEPVAVYTRILRYHALMIATKGDSKRLHTFVREVCDWRAEKNSPLFGTDRYGLFRFKTSNCEAYWSFEGMRRSRPESSVILRDGEMDAVMTDIRNFLSRRARAWYRENGLPHRRSFLFFGPPGTGKTSTIRSIASKFHLACCFLSMTNKEFSNQHLGDAFSKMPPKALLVLEDVDALFDENRKSDDKAHSVTFSGLLNALDGVMSADHVITVMTTNHVDKLDRALVRGGRVDRRFCFSQPGREEMKTLFHRFYPDCREEVLASRFSDAVLARSEPEARSIATLQQLFIMFREESAEVCANSVEQFFDLHYGSENLDGKTAENGGEQFAYAS